MATVPVEVKKPVTTPAAPAAPDVWQAFRTEMDRVFDRFSYGVGVPSLRRLFDAAPSLRWEGPVLSVPAMDIAEDDAGYTMTAELPGMAETDVTVELRGDMLTIKGEKKQESERDEAEMHLSERSYGAFTRSFSLPDGVDGGAIAASFTNGVLTVKLPKTKAVAPETKKIEVKSAA